MKIADKIKLAAELDEAIRDRERLQVLARKYSEQELAAYEEIKKQQRFIVMAMEQLGWVEEPDLSELNRAVELSEKECAE